MSVPSSRSQSPLPRACWLTPTQPATHTQEGRGGARTLGGGSSVLMVFCPDGGAGEAGGSVDHRHLRKTWGRRPWHWEGPVAWSAAQLLLGLCSSVAISCSRRGRGSSLLQPRSLPAPGRVKGRGRRVGRGWGGAAAPLTHHTWPRLPRRARGGQPALRGAPLRQTSVCAGAKSTAGGTSAPRP